MSTWTALTNGLLLAAALLALQPDADAPDPQEWGCVTGVVGFRGGEMDGRRAPGVRVSIEGREGLSPRKAQRTDDAGAFAFCGLPPDQYDLWTECVCAGGETYRYVGMSVVELEADHEKKHFIPLQLAEEPDRGDPRPRGRPARGGVALTAEVRAGAGEDFRAGEEIPLLCTLRNGRRREVTLESPVRHRVIVTDSAGRPSRILLEGEGPLRAPWAPGQPLDDHTLRIGPGDSHSWTRDLGEALASWRPGCGCVEGSADLAGPGVLRIQCEYLPVERFRGVRVRQPRLLSEPVEIRIQEGDPGPPESDR